MATVTMTTTRTELEGADDRFAGVDIDSLLQGGRRTLSYERRRALYEAPEFIQRLNGEETVLEGQSLCIECKIRGFPVPSVRWFKDDEEILDHPRIHVESDGIGGYFLLIDCVARGDEAAYRCRAENIEGACSSFLFLSVKGKVKKRDPMYCPSWRTVSYPPMFSTIVEKVEEEEKQAQECEGLPPSPLTEFYYALTLKSRCSWPTFLGPWAFAKGGPMCGRQTEENKDNDENEEDVEEEDSDSDDIDNKFCIPNGDICDNTMTRSSHKAHLMARKNMRKREPAARRKAKKQRIDGEVDNEKENGEDGRKRNKYEVNQLEDEKEERSNLEIKGRVGGLTEKTELEKRLEREKAENEEYEKREKNYIEEEKMRNERQCEDERRKEDEKRKVEKEKSNETIYKDRGRKNEDSDLLLDDAKTERQKDVEREKEVRSNNEESLQRRGTNNSGFVEKYSQENARIVQDDGGRETKEEDRIEKEVTFTRNRQNNTTLELDKKPEKMLDEVLKLNSRSTTVQDINNSQGPDSCKETAPTLEAVNILKETAPTLEAVNILKRNVYEDSYTGQLDGGKKLQDTKYGLDKNLKSAVEESHSDRKSRNEKIYQIGDRDDTWGQREDTNRRVGYRNDQNVSMETESRYSRRYPQQRQGLGRRQIADRDRLEELRQEEERRMEELRQEEEKRMEELIQEGATATSRLNRKQRTPSEDWRTREKRQIEELRRREQLQREELWQKEMKQREDLREREEKQKEELKLKGGLTEIVTSQKQEEELVKLRQELRLKELNQKEELKMRESQHKEELIVKGYVQKDEMIACDDNQIQELGQRERRQIEELGQRERRQIEELGQREWRQVRDIRVKGATCSPRLQGPYESSGRPEESRMERKKEQLRKEQLRRQYEEEQKRREQKQTDTKRQKEEALDLRESRNKQTDTKRQREEALDLRESRNKQTDTKRQREEALDLRESRNKQSYLFGDVRQVSGQRMRRDDIHAEDSRLTDRTGNMLVNSTIYHSSSANKENEREIITTKTNSRDDSEFSILNRLDSRWSDSWTRSLDRPPKRAVHIFKQYNEEEFPSRLSTRADQRQELLETDATQINSRQWQTLPRLREEECATRLRETNYSSRNGGSYLTSAPAQSSTSRNGGAHLTSATAQSSTSGSFASLFNLDEPRGSNPGLRSHQELLKLAENIAAEREMFHESLSRCSREQHSRPVPDTTRSLPSSLRKDADISSETPVYRRGVGRDSGRSGDNQIPEELLQTDKRVGRDSQRDNVLLTSTITIGSRDNAAVDTSAIEIRPFIFQSSRTIARRFYKKEVQS